MYCGSFDHGKIIEAFTRCVPGAYVRDYRDKGGYITVCRGYKDIPWRDQTTTRRVYRMVPDETLFSMPRGNITAPTMYAGVRMIRPGWREQFRKAAHKLTWNQRKKIEKVLQAKVFPEAS